MTVSAAQILAIAPRGVAAWAEELARAMPGYDITAGPRAAMFLAQCAHESAGFTVFEERLNYSVEALMRTWPSRFRSWAAAVPYARNPERLANHVYANRLGNSNEASGDGWRYRGRGCIQLTGRRNYARAGQAIGYPLDRYPHDLLQPHLGAPVACWFWQSSGLNELADRGEFEAVTRRINGGLTGIDDRRRYLARALEAFADDGRRYV